MSSDRTAELHQIAESLRLAVEIAGEAHGLRDPELIVVTILCAVLLVSKTSPLEARAQNMDATCHMLRQMCDLELRKPGSVTKPAEALH